MTAQSFRAALCAAAIFGIPGGLAAAPAAPLGAQAPVPQTPRMMLGPPAAIQIVTDKDNGKSFTLVPETALVVSLRANPSTGYEWNVVMPPSVPLTLGAAPTFTRDKASPGVVGVGGVEEFHFSPRYLPGVTQSFYLRLMSLRAFSPKVAGARLYEIHVTIPPQWTAPPLPAPPAAH